MRKNILLALFLLFPIFIPGQSAVNVSNSSSPSYYSSIAINGQGDVAVVWVEEFSASNKQIMCRVNRGGVWSEPFAIPGQSGVNLEPRICRGRGSNGFCLVWRDETSAVIKFCEYTGSTWISPMALSDRGEQTFGLFGEPSVGVTAGGRIVVAWSHPNPLLSNIFARVWQGGWGPIINLSPTHYKCKASDIAVGWDDRLYVVWAEDHLDDPGGGIETFWNSMDTSGNWQGRGPIQETDFWNFRPNVAVNSAGVAMVTFYCMQYASYNAIFYIDGGWTSQILASDVGDHHDHDAYLQDVCAYNDGFLMIYRDVKYEVVYKAASNGEFGPAIKLSSGGICYRPSIAYDSGVGAAAAWTEDDEVYVLLFTPSSKPPDPPIPPGPNPNSAVQPPFDVAYQTVRLDYTAADLRIETVENRNLFTIQIINKLTWAPSPVAAQYNIPLTCYRIFRREKNTTPWQQQGEVGVSQFEFLDKNQLESGKQYEYRVVGVDETGSTAYAFNRITWKENPKNAENGVVVSSYNIYRGVQGKYDPSGWRRVSAGIFTFDDATADIRAGVFFSYALSTVSSTGLESAKTTATYEGGASGLPIEALPVPGRSRPAPTRR